MGEQLLKVSAPYSKSSFQKFEKTLWGGGGTPPALPRVKLVVK